MPRASAGNAEDGPEQVEDAERCPAPPERGAGPLGRRADGEQVSETVHASSWRRRRSSQRSRVERREGHRDQRRRGGQGGVQHSRDCAPLRGRRPPCDSGPCELANASRYARARDGARRPAAPTPSPAPHPRGHGRPPARVPAQPARRRPARPARSRRSGWPSWPASTPPRCARTSPTWAPTAPGASATTSSTCCSR